MRPDTCRPTHRTHSSGDVACMAWQARGQPCGRRPEPQIIDLMGRPTAESSISVARRRARVAGRFAEITQCSACFRNDGGLAANHAHASSFARKFASSSMDSIGSSRCSKE